jgi:hypothetical protein
MQRQRGSRVRDTLKPDLGNASEGKLSRLAFNVSRFSAHSLETPLLAPSQAM